MAVINTYMKKTIQFTKTTKIAQANTVAEFDDAHAEKLIKLGIAKEYNGSTTEVEPARVVTKDSKINKVI